VPSIVLRLDPSKLDNPDLDLRHVIPDLLSERSNGAIRDNGYDYEGEGNRPILALYLLADDLDAALAIVRAFLATESVLGNQLQSVDLVAGS
jgi:hypothetical protein